MSTLLTHSLIHSLTHIGRNLTLCEVTTSSQWLWASIGHELAVVNSLTHSVVYTFTVAYSTEVVLGKEYIAKRASKGVKEKSNNITETAVSTWESKASVVRSFSSLGFATGKVPAGE